MRKIILLLLAFSLSGCAGAERQVKMSDDIKLSAPRENTIFIEVHNSSVAPLEDLSDLLALRFRQQGYQLKEDLDQAYYYLQLDVIDFGFFTENSRLPITPGIGVGIGTWGIGVGLGVGLSLSDLFASNSSRYVMSAYLRIEETPDRTMYESSLISAASQADMTFEQGLTAARDAMIDRIMSLF
jgi:hypothetical protein